MPYKPYYCYNEKENSGSDPCDILLQLYPDDGFRTLVMRQEDFEHLKPWELCMLLNRAREAGREDAMRDVRDLLGVK